MTKPEYMLLSEFLNVVVVQITKRDWEGFLSFIDTISDEQLSIEGIDISLQKQRLSSIKDLAAHMQSCKEIVLSQIADIIQREESIH